MSAAPTIDKTWRHLSLPQGASVTCVYQHDAPGRTCEEIERHTSYALSWSSQKILALAK